MSAQDLIGKQLDFGPADVSRDSILAFGKGISDDRPESTNPDDPDFRAHPMYCATAVIPGTGMVVFQPGLGVNVNRIVHGGIEINFHTPIRPGDQLSAVSSLDSVDDKGSGQLVNIVYLVTNQDGDKICDGITRYFSRAKGGEPGGGSAGRPAEPGAPDFTTTVQTGKDQSVLYAEGSGDRFPIHTDDNFAKSVGLPGMIMHGMCTLAMSASAVVVDQADGNMDKLRSLSCRFSHIVLPGDTLTIKGWRDGSKIRFETVDQDGNTSISDGQMTLG